MAKEKNLSKVTENESGVQGQYKNWFLDYASYVILERAVPAIEDGLKPVQRRILHDLLTTFKNLAALEQISCSNQQFIFATSS
jgi:DNA gyrase/topoisomerase IV subunit A